MHRNAPNVVSPLFDFTGMQAGADGQVQACERGSHRQGTANRASGAVERREHTIPRRFDQLPTLLRDEPTGNAIMLVECVAPSGIAQSSSLLSRVDDIGEKDRCQDSLRRSRGVMAL